MNSNIIEKIIFNIERSEAAFKLYIDGKEYYQALRILKANKEIYKLIIDNCEELDVNDRSEIFNYLFHLEDWFEQFEYKKTSNNPGLRDEFVFERFDGSPAYSDNIIQIFKRYNL